MNRPFESAPLSAVPGSCACGAVQFEIQLPTLICVHCHCSLCRTNHGAAFVTWVGVPKTQLRLLTAETALTRYRSSDQGRRSFCSQCGTPLFCEVATHPDLVDITLASLRSAIDRRPEAHIYFDTHVEWFEILDQLPRFGGAWRGGGLKD
jgi:hypothetical protein